MTDYLFSATHHYSLVKLTSGRTFGSASLRLLMVGLSWLRGFDQLPFGPIGTLLFRLPQIAGMIFAEIITSDSDRRLNFWFLSATSECDTYN